MHPIDISATIVVEGLDKARAFYATHLDGRLIFDCGWYIGFQSARTAPPCTSCNRNPRTNNSTKAA